MTAGIPRAAVLHAGRLGVFTLQVMCLVHLVNQHLFEVRMCKGTSMLPTLSPSGDLVVHLRLPFLRALASLPGSSADLASRFPRFPRGLPSAKADPSCGTGLRLGDVVVAESPADPSRTVCKRILGMPGDTVLVDPREGPDSDALPPGVDAKNRAVVRLHHARTVRIPPGHVWLVGDNLANSTDSRHYGPVPLALVKGRVLARLYPKPNWLSNGIHWWREGDEHGSRLG
ncbi:hypothetical protein MSPP1_003803 [Malassezia sp. CBS 17886]|nr:hypothetical protein MSPP1_003803 [Malassezia sp. CBS 17886]